jgi:hypothetical protein
MSASVKQDFKAMGKEELRAACRAVGIKYGKMTNDEMRAELTKFNKGKAQPKPKQVAKTKPLANSGNKAKPFDSLMGTQKVPENLKATPSTIVRDGQKITGVSVAGQGLRSSKTPPPELPRVARLGIVIEKGREESNGVRRPSKGTVCAKIWEIFDKDPSIRAADLVKIADSNLWDRTTVSCQFYTWRRFMGIKGRQPF